MVGAVNSRGLFAMLVWVAGDVAPAAQLGECSRDVRSRSLGGARERFRHYRRVDAVPRFSYCGTGGRGEVVRRHFVASGTMP